VSRIKETAGDDKNDNLMFLFPNTWRSHT